MNSAKRPPIGVKVSSDVEYMPNRPAPYRARVRWTDPQTSKRRSLSESHKDEEQAAAWIDLMKRAASGGIDPIAANMSLAEYGDANMALALRGVEDKTRDPYLAGWRKRVVPTLGHIPVRMITNGAVDRAVHAWIADEYSESTIKNSIAPLVRVMEQALRDGIIDRNPARVTGWQRELARAEDELDDPRSLALPDWATLTKLSDALVAASATEYEGWGDVVIFAACTAARIGEVSGCRVRDINTTEWTWNVRRQTTTAPGGLVDKGTKGKRARTVPLIDEVRELVQRRIAQTDGTLDARLFTGPRGGRITTAVLRDATSWDEVATRLGYEHLRRHDLRHTGLTWMADAGVPVHHLRKIAGHASLATTQRYLHPDRQSVSDAGALLSKHLRRSTDGPQLRAV
ncbi:site-specific recombinase XerD [Saccharopolyspora erythraea NRRL 2338]|uniref:Phage integrase n=2 Tax=Saccharopolyspora erythraea TaxID=1836 RepID=A4F8S7_SACEN|nr:site-specific integrase [Saccharopolyspora erythraea]EQD86749.1 integrase [Saccharopolyspora erythraea D]PFG94247.1 site-specific recombinase XerD [Saccharopolyspora erythraea NRRL 2338]QRK91019.1 site-specific integrase [Saccharopolyspora erythraea]CAM00452.1 phage integrase [Saccharopolyspora erythraea NRRL 2338]